jgi:[protein-PII] uridylyltransferase
VASPLSSPESIRESFLADGDAAALLRRRSAAVDDIVTSAFDQYLAPRFPSGLALLAVGGYGREELFPHSDVDLLILVERELQGDENRAALSTFLRTLWDAGLRLSQSVRTPAECCRFDPANVELSISLIDERLLTGDTALYESLKSKLAKYFETQRLGLVRHLANLTQDRHAKAQYTIFHLEPNIKENPGGIRDLHVIHWLGRLLGSNGESEPSLEEARRFLYNVRCRLHYKYGRDANVLTFEAQEESSPDPAQWMREFYRHSREINRRALRHLETSEALTESSLLRQFRDWRSRLSNADFTVSRERVFFRAPQQIPGDPELVLRLFAFTSRHGLKLAIETMRRIEEHLPLLTQYFSVSRPIWPLLREILSLPYAPGALRAMHQTGVLLALFPEWHEIECLVVRDFYHRYTVDEHTLEAIASIAALRDTKLDERRRFATLLAESKDEVPAIYLALLFHDCGKSDGLESHAARSAKLAAQACERIQVPAETRQTALFLIEHHLDLSALMLSRDLADPATMRELSERIATIENLKLLTLVTFGDISAVNPGALTPWRMEQLWLTYMRGVKEFTRELESDRIHEPAEPGAPKSFLEGFPTRYRRTHSQEEIQEHSLLAERARHAGVAIDLRRRGGFWLLTVVTGDRTGLFASLAGTISAFGMDISKAEAFANTAGVVIDTFAFSDPMRTLELNPDEADRLKLMVQRVVLGREDVRKLLKGRAKPMTNRSLARLKPTVAFDSQSSQLATLVEIVTEDRPGLLYDLASTMSEAGCSIEVVLIDTEAHKAIDVFYVTSGGGKLDTELQGTLRQSLLHVCGNGS